MKSFLVSTSHAAQERLRRQFASWSLAIVSTVVTSGTVCLDSSNVWATDDPPTAKDESAPKFDRNEFQTLVQSGKFDEAEAMLEAAKKVAPDDLSVLQAEMSLASFQMRTNRDKAVAKFRSLISRVESKLDSNAVIDSIYASASVNLAQALASSGKIDDAIKSLENASNKLASTKSSTSPIASSLKTLRLNMLVSADRAAEAKTELDAMFDKAVEEAKANPRVSGSLISLLSLYYRAFGDEKYADEIAKREKAAEEIAVAFADAAPDSLANFQPYQQLRLSQAQSLTYTNAKKAKAFLDELKERMDKLAEKLGAAEANQLERSKSQITQALRSLESALVREELIGKPAPEFDAQNYVAMDSVKLADLKGKVVLIDFWAVWCGPCIATFPHLKHWHEEYASKGLVIVGVTREYGYKWDEDAGRQVADKGATTEQELAMLEKFRKHHQLEHGFVVTPKESDYNKQFGVAGIPQAVLVDQDGVIRMIRVGSGDANAKALEDMIKKLLNKSASSS